MNVLIDTNVVLDHLLRREPYFEAAAQIIVLSEKGYICSYISASAVTDIFYIARKELRKDSAAELIKKLLETVRVAAVTESTIYEALELNWNDFEDSVQYTVGQGIAAEYIITRNPKDFSGGAINVISPDGFINKITI